MPTVLVVEDEVPIAELLREVLGDEGYRVVVARDGREGLRLVGQLRPDAVLSDVMLPHLDGRALARAMQRDVAYRHIPIILMTAASRSTVRDVPHAAFIAKPFPFDVLLDTVARVLKGRNGA